MITILRSDYGAAVNHRGSHGFPEATNISDLLTVGWRSRPSVRRREIWHMGRDLSVQWYRRSAYCIAPRRIKLARWQVLGGRWNSGCRQPVAVLSICACLSPFPVNFQSSSVLALCFPVSVPQLARIIGRLFQHTWRYRPPLEHRTHSPHSDCLLSALLHTRSHSHRYVSSGRSSTRCLLHRTPRPVTSSKEFERLYASSALCSIHVSSMRVLARRA